MINDKLLASTNVFVYLKQARHSNLKKLPEFPTNSIKNKESLSCEVYTNLDMSSNRLYCLNMTINLNSEIERLFPDRDLVNKIRKSDYFHLNIYASILNNDYQIFSNNSYQSKSNYAQVNLLDKINVEKILINNWNQPILFCNLYEIERLNLEFSLKKSSTDSDSSFESNKIEVFTIEVKVFNSCSRKDTSKASQYTFNQVYLPSTYENSRQNENRLGNESQTNLKVHVILPILLSFFFVTFIILIAIFFRRFRFHNCKDHYSCEKHISEHFIFN